MNIKPKHKNKKAHHNVEDRRDEDALQSPLSGAAAHGRQEQERAQYKLDTAQNGEDMHMASALSNFRLNHNS